MLFVQVAYDRQHLLPNLRVHDEPARFAIRTIHRRQLEKVTTNDKLNAAKWLVRLVADAAQHLVDHVEPEIVQHGDLVYNQHVGFENGCGARFTDVFSGARRQLVGNANATPRVNGCAAKMRGSKAGCGRYRHALTGVASTRNKLTQHIGLTRPSGPGQQHMLAAQHNLQRQRLVHLAYYPLKMHLLSPKLHDYASYSIVACDTRSVIPLGKLCPLRTNTPNEDTANPATS